MKKSLDKLSKAKILNRFSQISMGVWQGVAMDSLKFYPGPTCPILLRPAGTPPLKRPHSHFGGSPPAEYAACSLLLPLWTPNAVRHCCSNLGLKSRWKSIFHEVNYSEFRVQNCLPRQCCFCLKEKFKRITCKKREKQFRDARNSKTKWLTFQRDIMATTRGSRRLATLIISPSVGPLLNSS
jgi:hypothetical protein